MTKIIDETLGLPSYEEETENAIEIMEKATTALSKVDPSDSHDKEVNDILREALDAYKDIMDVGKNVNPERSARLFEVAGQFLKMGLDASNSKMDKELKMMKLRLEAKRLKVDDETLDKIGHGAEIVADRNSLLRALVKESEENTIEAESDEEADSK